jgi:hypothetical protein
MDASPTFGEVNGIVDDDDDDDDASFVGRDVPLS